ncbi:cation diffusion facilitator family transporter [Enemella sp. A6]|uniref:cation diffusion facilitator family transporter n=1 Tax=Enemella sp. A6 TaxID=3440152 RepID=UPI003EB8F0CF
MAEQTRDLTKFAWLSIAAAIATIALKTYAWWITDSVGLLSDAAESVVNLAAAVMALVVLKIAAKAPDKNHHWGHTKAEYFSGAIEGMLIFGAAGVIVVTAVQRLVNPAPLDNLGIGLLVSVIAAVLNGVVGTVLIRAGRRHRSMTLTADGKHLMTDVITSVGVVVGVGLVYLTGWTRLDPIVALAVGLNIMWTGWRLISESSAGLMDVSLPKEENQQIREALNRFIDGREVLFHAMRTREAGHRRFMEVHILVPGDWTVKRGHDVITELENSLHAEFPGLRVTTHLEPIEDPVSYADMEL